MFERLKDRVEKRAIAGMVIVPLVLAVVFFLGLACYFALRESLSPALSALVTAAAGIVVIAVILLITRLVTRQASSASPCPQDLPDQLEEFLQSQADPLVREWVGRHPDRAALLGLLVGLAAGCSQSFQKMLLDLVSRQAASETRKTADRRP